MGHAATPQRPNRTFRTGRAQSNRDPVSKKIKSSEATPHDSGSRRRRKAASARGTAAPPHTRAARPTSNQANADVWCTGSMHWQHGHLHVYSTACSYRTGTYTRIYPSRDLQTAPAPLHMFKTKQKPNWTPRHHDDAPVGIGLGTPARGGGQVTHTFPINQLVDAQVVDAQPLQPTCTVVCI